MKKLTNSFIENADFARPTKSKSTLTGNDNTNANDSIESVTSCSEEIIDLTLDSDTRPHGEQQSVIVTTETILNNSNVLSPFTTPKAKKRKHVTIVDAEFSGKKQKQDDTSMQSNIDSCSSATVKTIDNGTDNSDEMPYKCALCAKQFTRNSKLESHLKTHEKELLLQASMKQFRCSECPQCYGTKSSLKHHTESKHKKANEPEVNVEHNKNGTA